MDFVYEIVPEFLYTQTKELRQTNFCTIKRYMKQYKNYIKSYMENWGISTFTLANHMFYCKIYIITII